MNHFYAVYDRTKREFHHRFQGSRGTCKPVPVLYPTPNGAKVGAWYARKEFPKRAFFVMKVQLRIVEDTDR